jgi:hypothetical protein
MNEYKTAQCTFFFNVCRFGLWLKEQGYFPSFGEAWRTEWQAQWYEDHNMGIADSLHRDRMAVDIIIRKEDGTQISNDEYMRCGTAWLALDPKNEYGGSWQDYQHFSRGWGGRK